MQGGKVKVGPSFYIKGRQSAGALYQSFWRQVEQHLTQTLEKLD